MTDPLTAPGLAGDVDYTRYGHGYAYRRRTEPRIAALVHAALGDARTVLNVGAGAGSYEPRDRYVLAIEPSAAMRAQRAPHLAPAIDGVAERLPFDDDAVDAAMALVTVHQWRDLRTGLQEMRRVSRGPVVVLTFDGDALDRFWLADYAPELITVERRRYPAISMILEIPAAVGWMTCPSRSTASTDSPKRSTRGPTPFCGRTSADRSGRGRSCPPRIKNGSSRRFDAIWLAASGSASTAIGDNDRRSAGRCG